MFTNRNIDLLILALSSFSLLIVYYLEYFLNLEPCILCIYQRYPYFLAIFLSLISLILRMESSKRFLPFLLFFTFLISICLSSYHFGIENGFWESLSSCDVSNLEINNNSELKNYLLKKDFVSCDAPAFSFLGISLTGYNILMSLILLALSGIKINLRD